MKPGRGPVTVAVTGPLASGKSTFVEMLGDFGAETVSADEIVHHLLAEDEETVESVVRRFGEVVRGEGGAIDRKALGGEVFGDPEALQDLEEILHPRVREEVDRRAAASDAELFAAEIPLLFEGEDADKYDVTVALRAPKERRWRWAEERGMEEEQLQAIEKRQLSGEEKAQQADVAVENDGDLDNIREQARALVDRVLGERDSSGERGTGEEA
jgi:dephospho-CoA kinase